MRVLVLALAMVAVALAVSVLPTAVARQESTFDLPADAPAIDGLETFADLSFDHVPDTVDYVQDPPAGGSHNPVWQNCEFYAAPVRNEHAVHSQEHGAVWITYQPDLAPDQLEPLQRLAARNEYVLVSPYPGLADPIVLSAWGAQLRLDDAADARLREFIRFYAGNGPERGAPCDGGTEETLPLNAAASPTPGVAATPVP